MKIALRAALRAESIDMTTIHGAGFRLLDVKSEVSAQAGTAKLTLCGDLDAESGKKARKSLTNAIDAGCLHVTVNLDQVGFLDSSGLASLISALRFARERGGYVRMETSNQRIRRVMEVTALARVFKLRPTAAAA
jgi:anti-sigma B factor antagonist